MSVTTNNVEASELHTVLANEGIQIENAPVVHDFADVPKPTEILPDASVEEERAVTPVVTPTSEKIEVATEKSPVFAFKNSDFAKYLYEVARDAGEGMKIKFGVLELDLSACDTVERAQTEIEKKKILFSDAQYQSALGFLSRMGLKQSEPVSVVVEPAPEILPMTIGADSHISPNTSPRAKAQRLQSELGITVEGALDNTRLEEGIKLKSGNVFKRDPLAGSAVLQEVFRDNLVVPSENPKETLVFNSAIPVPEVVGSPDEQIISRDVNGQRLDVVFDVNGDTEHGKFVKIRIGGKDIAKSVILNGATDVDFIRDIGGTVEAVNDEVIAEAIETGTKIARVYLEALKADEAKA